MWWTEKQPVHMALLVTATILFFQSFFPPRLRRPSLPNLFSLKSQCFLSLLLPLSAVFPTLSMELMCSGSSLQWFLDPSCVPVSAMLINLCVEEIFSLGGLLYVCQSETSSTILLLVIWYWDNTTWHLCQQQIFQSSCSSALLVSMLNNAVPYGPPSITQFHSSLLPSFCLPTS